MCQTLVPVQCHKQISQGIQLLCNSPRSRMHSPCMLLSDHAREKKKGMLLGPRVEWEAMSPDSKARRALGYSVART